MKEPKTHNLPDEWVDAKELREVIDKWEGREITSDAHLLYREVEALLPAPRTMDKIEWDDEKHGLAEAVAEWFEGEPTKVVMLSKVDGKIMVHQDDKHSSGLRRVNPGILTPTGRKYRLEPEDDTPTPPIEDKPAPEPAAPRPEDVPEFDPDYIYTDRDGDEWEYIDGRWITGDTHAERVAERKIHPGHNSLLAEHGPYGKDRLAHESAEQDDEQVFDPAYTYRDKEGDEWQHSLGDWLWLTPDGDIHGRYPTPPAEYGPYTRIEKEETNA